MRQQPVQAGETDVYEGALTHQPRLGHGMQDAAAACGNLLVGGPAEPQLELLGARAREEQVGVRVDEPRQNHSARGIHHLCRLWHVVQHVG